MKKYIYGAWIWIAIVFSTGVFASAGTIWDLFVFLSWNRVENGTNISDEYRLDGKNIQDNTVTTHEILDGSLTTSDISSDFIAPDASKIQWKTATESLGSDNTTIPTSLAVRNYIDEQLADMQSKIEVKNYDTSFRINRTFALQTKEISCPTWETLLSCSWFPYNGYARRIHSYYITGTEAGQPYAVGVTELNGTQTCRINVINWAYNYRTWNNFVLRVKCLKK